MLAQAATVAGCFAMWWLRKSYALKKFKRAQRCPHATHHLTHSLPLLPIDCGGLPALVLGGSHVQCPQSLNSLHQNFESYGSHSG